MELLTGFERMPSKRLRLLGGIFNTLKNQCFGVRIFPAQCCPMTSSLRAAKSITNEG